jgi:hypothetical protein
LFAGPQANYPVVVVGVLNAHFLIWTQNHGCSGSMVVNIIRHSGAISFHSNIYHPLGAFEFGDTER